MFTGHGKYFKSDHSILISFLWAKCQVALHSSWISTWPSAFKEAESVNTGELARKVKRII